MSGVKHLAMRARVDELTKALVSKDELARLVAMERARMGECGMTREEAIAVRLYTGPPFMKFNTVLRLTGDDDVAAWMTEHLHGNRYVTSIHTCVSGMVKLSSVSRIPDTRKVYRGMAGMRLPKCFWSTNQWGARGGVELAFLSTTTRREVAMQYIPQGKALPTVLEIEVGMIDKGASVSLLSQFPGEDEVLVARLLLCPSVFAAAFMRVCARFHSLLRGTHPRE